MIRGYEVASSTTVTVATCVAAALVSGATFRAKVREIGVFSQSATAYRGAIARAGTTGVGNIGSILGLAQDPADAVSSTCFVTSWTTNPLAPTNNLRQFDFNNVPGSGVIFTWPSDGELILPVSANLDMPFNVLVAPLLDVYTVYGE